MRVTAKKLVALVFLLACVASVGLLSYRYSTSITQKTILRYQLEQELKK